MIQRKTRKENSLSKFLVCSVDITNSFLLQIKAGYKLKRKNRKTKLPESTDIILYFVLPQQINLSDKSYTLNSFYEDFVSVLRLREPKISFKQFYKSEEHYKNSSLHSVESYLEESIQGERFERSDYYIDEVKIFGLSFERYVKKRSNRYRELFKNQVLLDKIATKNELNEDLDYFLRVLKVLNYWKRIRSLSKNLPKSYLSTIKKEIKFVDEYCLTLYLGELLKVIEILDSTKNMNPTVHKIIKKKLVAHYRLINYTCFKEGYDVITYFDSVEKREQYLFHRGWLKRRISKALYLDLRKKPIFWLQKQVGAMIAAAIAGAWAGIFSLFVGMDITDTNSFLRNNTAIIIMALTLAYVLKDRIKEIGRDNFKNLFFHLPDHINKIIYKGEAKNPTPVNIGEIREKAHFLENSPNTFVDKIFDEFSIDLKGEIGEKKVVIRYIKTFLPNKNSSSDLPDSMDTVHEIMRYNMTNLIEKLDSPYQTLLVLKKDSVVKVLAPKNYAIGLIMRLKTKTGNKNTPEIEKVFKYKLVVNKSGIQRLEKLKKGSTF